MRSGSEEPGRRSVSAVSSKSSPEDAAEEDSVELRAGPPSDMAGLGRWGWRRRVGGCLCGCSSGRVAYSRAGEAGGFLFPSVGDEAGGGETRREGAGGRREEKVVGYRWAGMVWCGGHWLLLVYRRSSGV